MFFFLKQKKGEKKKQENIKPKTLLFYFGLFVDLNISNFSQKIKKSKTIIAFWDTSNPPMSNVGFQPTDI